MAAVVAVLLVGSLLWLARDRTAQPEIAVTETIAPSQPSPTALGVPVAGAAGGWTCPVALPYAAYTGSRYFPPNHPGHPEPTVKPEACFATALAARIAGYFEGMTVGLRTVDGVYLIPLPGQPGEACRPAADLLEFPVPCPTLLPNQAYGGIPFTCSEAGGDASADVCVWHGSAFLFEEGAFDVPPEYYTANAQNVPHLFVAAWTKTSRLGMPSSLFRASLICPGAMRTGSVDVSPGQALVPVRADVLACRQGNNPAFQHTLLRWRSGGVTYEVGVLGFSSTSLDLATAVASTLVLVEPNAPDS